MKKQKNGFTLLELMVVIAITGILSSVSLVSFIGSKRSTAVRLSAENFAQFLRATEGMTRSGAQFPDNPPQERDCDDGTFPVRKTKAPCGGWGVVVSSRAYDRFADTVNVALRQKDAGDPVGSNDHVDLPDNVAFSTGTGVTAIFVPPKDTICLHDSAETKCGPAQIKEVAWKLEYSGGLYPRTVTLNSVSGIVTVE